MMIAYIALDAMLIFLLIEMLIICFTGVVTGKYFDAKLKEYGQKLPIVIRVCCSKRCARANIYLLLVLTNGNPFIRNQYKWYPQSFVRHYQINFGDIDYRALARKRDWVMAVLFWGSMVCFLFSGIVMCLTSILLGLNN